MLKDKIGINVLLQRKNEGEYVGKITLYMIR